MSKLPPYIETAYSYGALKKDYTLEDYMIDAAENEGYETVCIWGVQGSGKSSRMLQMGHWVLGSQLCKDGHDPSEEEIWDAVLDHIIFRPRDFVKRLKEVPRGQRLSVLLWDDIGCHYPSSKFKTDPLEYEAIDQTWAVIRTKVGVVIVTIPLISRLAKNIRDNLSFEVFLGRNQKEMIKRMFFLPGIDRQQANLFKVIVEKPEQFDLHMVPEWVWKRYWEMRLDLTDEVLATLEGTVDMEESEHYVLVKDAAKYAGLNPNTIQQAISRGVYRGRKVGGLLAIHKEDMNDYLEIKGKSPLE